MSEKAIWKQKETESIFSGLRYIITVSHIVISLIFLFRSLLHRRVFYLDAVLALAFSSVLVSYWLIKKDSLRVKKLSVVFFCEVFNLMNLYLRHCLFPGHSHGLTVISTSFVVYYEIKVIQSPKVVLGVLVKHVGLWLGSELWKLFNNIYEDIPALYCSLVFIYLVYWNEKSRKKQSLELFQNQTEREALQDRLCVLIENMPEGLLLLSPQNEILLQNLNILEIFLPDQNIMQTIAGLNYTQERRLFFNNSVNPSLLDDIKKCFELDLNEEVTLGITEYMDKNLEWKAKKIQWGNFSAVLLVVKNVDELMKLEQVSAENRCKNAILRSVSHELKTPTNSISALTQKLIATENFTGSCLEELKIIGISTSMLSSLVNDLLDYSKILAGVFRIETSETSIRDTFLEVVRLIEIQASKKGVKLFLRLDPSLPQTVVTDGKRLRQVLLNLLSNAVKFTFKGEIELCGWVNSRNNLAVSVRDTGIGIAPERLRELFGLFNRVHSTEVRAEGCGLGLHISNLLVKELGGQCIEVSSGLGLGSVFSFDLKVLGPACIVEADDSTDLPNEIEHPIYVYEFQISKQRPDLMIVDDDSFNRYIVVTLLESLNLQIAEACNGKEAVEKTRHFDRIGCPLKVIIMDCNMPEMNGWEATEVIVEDYKRKNISKLPFIIGYTAFSGIEEITQCERSGMKKVLMKPVNAEVLLKSVASNLA